MRAISALAGLVLFTGAAMAEPPDGRLNCKSGPDFNAPEAVAGEIQGNRATSLQPQS
jgi:hypothetical protein